jgi:hypothetical protein
MATQCKLGPKAQARKDDWIRETQMFQRIARAGDEPDSYDALSAAYDEDASIAAERKAKRKAKK